MFGWRIILVSWCKIDQDCGWCDIDCGCLLSSSLCTLSYLFVSWKWCQWLIINSQSFNRRHASRVHFVSNSFGPMHFVFVQTSTSFSCIHQIHLFYLSAAMSATLSTSMSATKCTPMSVAIHHFVNLVVNRVAKYWIFYTKQILQTGFYPKNCFTWLISYYVKCTWPWELNFWIHQAKMLSKT